MIIKMEVENALQESGMLIASDSTEMITKTGTRGRWRFIDGLKSVEARDIDHDSVPPADSYEEFYLVVMRERSADSRVWIEAKRSNGAEVCIVSERTVYLLNDSGKTIERLN